MPELKRRLGFWQAYATATGLVVAGSTMVSLGNSFGTIGPAFIVSAFIAMLVSIMIAMSYAELSSIMPGSGMVGDYTAVSMGRFMAIVALLGGYLVLTAAVGPMETMTTSMAVHYIFPGFNPVVIAFCILTVFLIINLLGVEIFGSIQLSLVVILMVMTAGMGLFGLFDLFTVNKSVPSTFNPHGWSTVFQSLALGLWLFIGIEYVIPLGEEVKNPEKIIPKAMIFGLSTIFVVDMLFGIALTRHIDLTKLSSADIPQILGAKSMYGHTGAIIMALLTLLAGASTINSNLAAIPRMFYGLARQGLLPRIFGYIHPTFRTPWFSIILVYLMFALPLLVLKVNVNIMTTMLMSASVTWLISYIITQVDLLIIRKRYSHIKRPFKAPFTPFIQIIGISVCLYMILTIHPNPETKRIVYYISGGFMFFICLYAFCWLKFKKMPLFKPVSLEELKSQSVFIEQPIPQIQPDQMEKSW
ncbi:APC family permease [Rummeliibacillus sp. NPDC094406]|uniref:APC family permease n=1 Tax=Rummeliibacillus sp. NPDC094406 TaxID=3364511 RepID=UPI003818C3D5